jgi:hypothetical protein
MGTKWKAALLPITKCLQESRMRENRTSGSMRGNSGTGTSAIHCSLLYWVGVVLTTDSTDGHRSDAFYVRSHLCPSVVKTGLSFDIVIS